MTFPMVYIKEMRNLKTPAIKFHGPLLAPWKLGIQIGSQSLESDLDIRKFSALKTVPKHKHILFGAH